jgi:hypothetical protein
MTTDELHRLRYSEALAQYRQHVPLVWTRNNFFLLVQSGLIAVVATKDKAASPATETMIGLIGVLIAVIWLWVNVASQRVLRQWRSIVLESEALVFVDPAQPGPFGRARQILGEGRRILISITTALYALNLSFLFFWIWWWLHWAF